MAASPLDFLPLADLAAGVAVEAGALLLAAQREGATGVGTKNGPADFVSDADRGSELLIVDALSSARPEDGLLGEEGAFSEGTTGLRWVIDPLDGTTNFLLGRSDYAVSIGLEEGGVPVAGVVYRPRAGELYVGVVGVGSTLNGVPISPRPTTSLGGATVSFGGGREGRSTVLRLAAALPEVGDIRRIGAGASEVVSVSSGNLDAYVQHGDQLWDLVAGTAIAVAAGAEVFDVPVGGLTLGVVAAPRLARELESALLGAALS